jgi:hypothetical protein
VGEIQWDVDWNRHELTGVYKLAVVDSGIGMTGPEMVEYINNLSSSIHEQSAEGNFGVGAKIAAAPRNPEGLIYLSWKDGQGYMIHLWFDRKIQKYGLRRFPENDGEFWCYIADDIKPEPIQDHGTMAILLGEGPDHNTMEPPSGTAMPSRWILRYLNTRYFQFPKGVCVKTREGWEVPRANSRHNFLREIHGQGPWLDKYSEAKGTVAVDGAKAHWWILQEEVDKDSGHNAGGGHVAALYQNELYEMAAGRAGLARLQAFGIIFGCDRVVIYVQPTETQGRVEANTSRTQLHIDAEPISWADWAAEFRDNIPQELAELQEEIGAKVGQSDYRKAIRERLKQIKDLLRFSRYRPAPKGDSVVDLDETGGGGKPAHSGQEQKGSREGGGGGGRAGDIYALFAEKHGNPAEQVGSQYEPDTKWISVADGTRTSPDLDDRAAKFRPEQNLLLINKDFRVFNDMIDRWEVNYAHVPGARTVIEQVVYEWFEQQLLEAVLSALALRRTGSWSLQELERLWSEEALTTAVLPRYHIDVSIKRTLGHRLGKTNAA